MIITGKKRACFLKNQALFLCPSMPLAIIRISYKWNIKP